MSGWVQKLTSSEGIQAKLLAREASLVNPGAPRRCGGLGGETSQCWACTREVIFCGRSNLY
eukprot:2733193-Rhodomonas_salina.3